MTEYLILPTEKDAVTRSRDAWETVLGRKKNPEDVTEFLWRVDVGKDGQAALVIDDKTELLSPQEATAVVTVLPTGSGQNWENTDTASVPVTETISQ